MNERRSGRCDAYDERLADLALGMLNGRERAGLLDHVEGCPHCAEVLEQLSRAADALLEVVPETEPPVGFEVRVLEHLGRQSRRRLPTHSLRRLSAMAAAVALLAGAGFGLGRVSVSSSAASATGHGTPASVGARDAAVLTLAGKDSGEILIYPGHPGWMLMAVNGLSVGRYVTCLVTTSSGQRITVGTFWLSRGGGAWASPLPVPVTAVRSASLETSSGHLLGTARFSA